MKCFLQEDRMYDFLLEISHSIWKNGLTLSALGTALYVLLKQRKVKKRLSKFLPMLFDDETAAYIENQKRIEMKIDLLLQKEGIHCANLTPTARYPSTPKTSFTFGSQGKSIARSVGKSMNYLIMRGMKRMNKLKSRKLWMTIVTALLIVANDGLDLNLPTEAIVTVASVVISYVLGEAYIDGKKVKSVEEYPIDHTGRVDD
jgi:hypothetical protein